MNNNNYYNILEVNENATQEQIKKSYRQLSLKYHPDRNKNNIEASERMRKINEAYETLSDIQKRKEYDFNLKNPFLNGNEHNIHSPFDDIFNSFFGMSNQNGMNMNGIPFPFAMHFNNNPFSNNHNHNREVNENIPNMPRTNIKIFHNGIPVNLNMNEGGLFEGLNKPSPIIKNISINISNVLLGITYPLEIERWIIENGNKLFEKETIYIDIPKGIDDGEIIILKEKGNVVNELIKGDIKLFIKIENNTEFKRNGLDLIYNKILTLKEALIGFSFELKYLNGKNYIINNFNNNIISPGFSKIIPNMGLTRDDKIGNLIINFDIKFPEKLSQETIDVLTSLDL